MDIYIASTRDDGVLGAAATPDLAKALAGERVSDYFDKPVDWKIWNEGTPQEHWTGEFHESAHTFGVVWVERVEMREA